MSCLNHFKTDLHVVKGEDQFLAMLGPNGFFGEMGLFTEGALRSASCVALTQTTCASVDRTALHDFCSQHPEVGIKIYRAIVGTLAQRLQSTSADLAMLMGSQVRSQREVTKIVDKKRDAD